MAKILVIDDDPDVRQILQVMLKRGGHEVSLAPGGKSGLEMATSQSYDLVITDVMMPDMDGYEVTRQLRLNPATHEQTILILTARAQPADYQAAMASGADAYLSKPVTHDMLNMRVGELLRVRDVRQSPGTRAPQYAPPPTPVSASQPQARITPVTTSANSAQVPVTPRSEKPNQRETVDSLLEVQPQPIPQPSLAEVAKKVHLLPIVTMRGGVGNTTFAVNLGLLLAKAKRKVCVLDLSASVGHVALQLGLKPDPTWQELAPEPDPRQVGKLLLKHSSGLYVLAAPAKPMQRTLHISAFVHLCRVLSDFFNDIIIDGISWPSELARDLLRHSHHLYTLFSPDVGSVQTIKGYLRLLDGMEIPLNRVSLILNQTSPQNSLQPATLEKAIGQALAAKLPYESGQFQALIQSRPLASTNAESEYCMEIKRLLSQQLGETINFQ